MLTRGAAVIGIGIGAGTAGCDRAGAGDAPTAPNASSVAPQTSAPAVVAASDDAGAPVLPTRRMPVPNAMPLRLSLEDGGMQPAASPSPQPKAPVASPSPQPKPPAPRPPG